MKWQTAANNPPGKIQVSKVNRALGEFRREHTMRIELSGVIGRTEGVYAERKSAVGKFCIGGPETFRVDVSEAQEKIGTKYAWTVSKDNAATIVADVETEMAALIAGRPIEDLRETETQRATQEAEMAEIRRAREEGEANKTAAYLGAYGSPESVTIQPGQMAVVAKLCFDDSDMQSDYFSPHAPLGPELCLMVVPKGREDEAKAQAALARFPELAAVGGWQWATEKYSMGHGNYLTSDGVSVSPEVAGGRDHYRGGPVECGHWEIQFKAAYSTPFALAGFKGYPGTVAPSSAPESATDDGAALRYNRERNGIEIRFPAKPAASVLEQLKAAGWRWARFNGCWYARASEAALALAERLTGTKADDIRARLAGGSPTVDRFDCQVEDNMRDACGL